MFQDEITYEQSLEMMNESGLRSECLRLKTELDLIHVQQLTQPAPKPGHNIATLNIAIQRKRQEFSEICQKDMSEPTTGELNKHREIQSLITERNRLIDAMGEEVSG